MDLKYRIVVYLGILVAAIVALLFFLRKKKDKDYEAGVKVANTYLLDQEPYFATKKKLYKIFSIALIFFWVLSVVCGCFLLARPYRRELVTEEKYCRDIILCLDVSTSVDEVNKKLVTELMDMVKELQGERFGIVIFNTSPLILAPLTDDYDYILETLENIKTALEERLKTDTIWGFYDSDYFYWDSYISDGTLVGNEERGSSLIGDGLASCVNCFSKTDTERTKLVIFSTDNDPYGDELVDLPQAAAICKDRGITVYGIGTKEMTYGNMDEMKQSVEYTGGEFFLQEQSGTFESIVNEVKKHSENLVAGKSYYKNYDTPRKAFLWLLFATASLLAMGKLLKK